MSYEFEVEVAVLTFDFLLLNLISQEFVQLFINGLQCTGIGN